MAAQVFGEVATGREGFLAKLATDVGLCVCGGGVFGQVGEFGVAVRTPAFLGSSVREKEKYIIFVNLNSNFFGFK